MPVSASVSVSVFVCLCICLCLCRCLCLSVSVPVPVPVPVLAWLSSGRSSFAWLLRCWMPSVGFDRPCVGARATLESFGRAAVDVDAGRPPFLETMPMRTEFAAST